MSVRLALEQIDFFKKEISKYLKNPDIYLFGSRADEKKKGGDIDILVLADKKLPLEDKISILVQFQKQFGEQKVDLVSFSHKEKSSFKDLILYDAIKL